MNLKRPCSRRSARPYCTKTCELLPGVARSGRDRIEPRAEKGLR